MDVMNFLLSNGYSTGVSSIDALVKRKLACALRSSTEYSQTVAWVVNFNDGYTANSLKYGSGSVRAVAAF